MITYSRSLYNKHVYANERRRKKWGFVILCRRNEAFEDNICVRAFLFIHSFLNAHIYAFLCWFRILTLPKK